MSIAIPQRPRPIHRPTESELMDMARLNLARRVSEAPAIRHLAVQAVTTSAPLNPERHERRMRSLRTCHLPSLYERPRHAEPKDRGAFVPEASARLDDDMNLTDGARRCARKIMEETYRRDRSGRKLQVTVSYLARGLRRSGRTVQRYLRMLEREGYLRIMVLSGHRSRLCIGLIIQLLRPLFPRHHRDAWPENRGKSGVTNATENHRYKYLDSYNPHFRTLHDPRCRLYTREAWSEKCLQGTFRAVLKATATLRQALFSREERDRMAGACDA